MLSVRSNRLTSVPAELGHLSPLRVLNLCSNRISHLPCSFTKLHNLQVSGGRDGAVVCHCSAYHVSLCGCRRTVSFCICL